MSLIFAQSGHALALLRCPLLRLKQTWRYVQNPQRIRNRVRPTRRSCRDCPNWRPLLCQTGI